MPSIKNFILILLSIYIDTNLVYLRVKFPSEILTPNSPFQSFDSNSFPDIFKLIWVP